MTAGVVFFVLTAVVGWPSSRPAWAEPPPPCAARTAELEAGYRRADARPDSSGFLPVSTGFEAPTLAGAGAADTGAADTGALTMTVEVGASQVLVDGRPLDGIGIDPSAADRKKLGAAVAREISESRACWKTLHGGQAAPPAKLGIWFDRRGKAADAVTLLKDLSRKREVAVLGLAAPEPGERDRKEPPAPVRKRLDEIRTTTELFAKSKLIASAVRDALAGCPQRDKMLESLDATAPGAQANFHRLIVKTVGACGCAGVDFDLLEAVTLPGPEARTVLARPLRLEDGAAARVTLPATADVQQLLDRLPASGPFSVRWQGAAGARRASPDGK